MEALNVLPMSLQKISVSQKEVVLPFEAAIQALEYFEKAQWALLGWEGLIRHAGNLGSALNYQGTVSLNRDEGESWSAYVTRTADICRQSMRTDQKRFEQDLEQKESELYFCLTATAEN